MRTPFSEKRSRRSIKGLIGILLIDIGIVLVANSVIDQLEDN